MWLVDGQTVTTKTECSGHGFCRTGGVCDCYAGFGSAACDTCPQGQERRGGTGPCVVTQAAALPVAASKKALASATTLAPTPAPTPFESVLVFTTSPTPSPAAGETAAPTPKPAEAEKRSVAATMLFNGMTQDAFDETRKAQFRAAVGAAVGVSAGSVTITRVTPLSLAGRLRRVLAALLPRRALANAGISVDFEIVMATVVQQKQLLQLVEPSNPNSAPFLAALTNAVQVSLADADAVAWAGVTASVAPGSVSDPHSTAAVVGGSGTKRWARRGAERRRRGCAARRHRRRRGSSGHVRCRLLLLPHTAHAGQARACLQRPVAAY